MEKTGVEKIGSTSEIPQLRWQSWDQKLGLSVSTLQLLLLVTVQQWVLLLKVGNAALLSTLYFFPLSSGEPVWQV